METDTAGAIGERITRRTEGIGTTALAALLTTLAVMPVMLLSALAVLTRHDLRFDRAALGLAIGIFFGTSSLLALPAGRFTEWLGAHRIMVISAVATLFSILGTALFAGSWGTLALFLLLAGIGNSLAHPASNLALSRGVPAEWQGLAFGVKQASIPLAGLLAGLAVPSIALHVGWRVAFASSAALVIPLALLLASSHVPRGRPPRRLHGLSRGLHPVPLLVLTLAFAFGSVAANSLGGFIVESAVASGVSVSTAGFLFAVNNGLGIGARILYGWRADRRGAKHLHMVAVLLIVGAAGFVALSLSPSREPLLWIGSILGFIGGWSWPGLFNFAIVRAFPGAPATATGATLAGGYAGSTVGPIAFGLIVRHTSFPVAWICVAAAALIGASLMVVGRNLVLRRRATIARGADESRTAARTTGRAGGRSRRSAAVDLDDSAAGRSSDAWRTPT